MVEELVKNPLSVLLGGMESGGGGGDTSYPHIELSNLSIVDGVLLINGSVKVDGITGFSMLDIQGVGDLSPENIAEGKTICGVKGTLQR